MAINKPNNAIRIPCSLSDFFKYWFLFLEPFHNLTNREVDVITSFVRQRYELSKVIKDNEILDKVAMSEDVKKKVREECGITLQHFQVILGSLRKNKVIVNNRINPKFIPSLKEDSDYLTLMFYCKIEDESKDLPKDSKEIESKD